jgi:hypothetical protein
MTICAAQQYFARLPVLIDDPALPDAAQERFLADHPTIAAAEPYWTAVGQDPETAEPRHRGRDRRGELRAMIVIDIFGENHRFSN